MLLFCVLLWCTYAALQKSCSCGECWLLCCCAAYSIYVFFCSWIIWYSLYSNQDLSKVTEKYQKRCTLAFVLVSFSLDKCTVTEKYRKFHRSQEKQEQQKSLERKDKERVYSPVPPKLLLIIHPHRPKSWPVSIASKAVCCLLASPSHRPAHL